MNYLDSNLLTLNNNLLRANFDRILDSIWVEVLEEIQDVLNKEDPVSRRMIDPFITLPTLKQTKSVTLHRIVIEDIIYFQSIVHTWCLF